MRGRGSVLQELAGARIHGLIGFLAGDRSDDLEEIVIALGFLGSFHADQIHVMDHLTVFADMCVLSKEVTDIH